MAKRIDKITLRSFRGASEVTEIELDSKKPLVLIFGENGTGKSTILDAIDLVGNRSHGSLDDRSVGRKIGYLPNIGKKKEDVFVELKCGEATHRGTIDGLSVSVKTSGDPLNVQVLRRAKILQLVEATPQKRYEALQAFIDVGSVEKSETALRNAQNSATNELNAMASKIADAESSLQELWEKEGSAGENAESWAKAKSEADRSNLDVRKVQLDAILQKLRNVKDSIRAVEETEEKYGIAVKAQEEITQEIENLPTLDGKQTISLIALLDKTQTHLSIPPETDECPVCGRGIALADLKVTIEEKLASLKEFNGILKKYHAAEKSLSQAKQDRKTTESTFVELVRTAAEAFRSAPDPVAPREPIEWTQFEALLNPETPRTEAFEAAKALATPLVGLIEGFTKKHNDIVADLHQLNAIKTAYDRVTEHREKANDLTKICRRLSQAVTIVETSRKDFTQRVLEEVGAESERLYELIHPDESLGKPRLKLDPKKRTSVDQHACFNGHEDIPPQAYYSESHLDTLGFCVWLAIAKRSQPRDTIIVLDDIFTSVDSVHLRRIMELLETVVPDFLQVIVTTHYRTWRDLYRHHHGGGNVQLLELNRWSLARGITVSGTKLAVDELKDSLQSVPFNRQAVASQSGILLEALLDGLTLQYRKRLPRTRDGVWTLGDLLDGCSKLGKDLEVEKTVTTSDETTNNEGKQTEMIKIAPLLAKVASLNFIRNQVGCHFNLAGADVPDNDVEAFGQATVDLVEALLCSDCTDIPRRRAGSFFQCRCKQTALRPLEHTK